MFARIAVLACCTAFSVEASGDDSDAVPLDVFLFAGQSNMVGADANAALLPTDKGDANIWFWFSVGDPPPDKYDSTSNQSWTTLRPQPKGNPAPYNSRQRQWGNFHTKAGFGPEIGFARSYLDNEMATAAKPRSENGRPPFAILKVAYSGTSVENDWDPRQSDGDNSCYAALIREYRHTERSARVKGFQLRPAAFFWIQGESDAGPARVELYQNRLHQMLLCLREDLSNTRLPCFLGVNTKFGKGRVAGMESIVAQQKALARLPQINYVDTTNATTANPQHFDTEGTLLVGRLLAEAFEEHCRKDEASH
ncbi:MAG: sialate O-acetylesterase [Planctomycetota bacterium]